LQYILSYRFIIDEIIVKLALVLSAVRQEHWRKRLSEYFYYVMFGILIMRYLYIVFFISVVSLDNLKINDTTLIAVNFLKGE